MICSPPVDPLLDLPISKNPPCLSPSPSLLPASGFTRPRLSPLRTRRPTRSSLPLLLNPPLPRTRTSRLPLRVPTMRRSSTCLCGAPARRRCRKMPGSTCSGAPTLEPPNNPTRAPRRSGCWWLIMRTYKMGKQTSKVLIELFFSFSWLNCSLLL